MKSTQIISTLALAITLGSASAVAGNAVSNAPVSVNMADDAATGNDEATVNAIQARLDNFEKNLNDVKAIAAALNATDNYQSTIDELTAALASLKEQFAADIEAGIVVEGYQLEGLSAAEGQMSGLLGPLSGQFNYMVSSYFQRSYPVNGQISSTLAQLSRKLENLGLTEQYAERLAALQAKAQEASDKLTEYQVQVANETDYAKKLQLAQEAEQYINGVKDEILAECAAIEAAAQAIYDEKVVANQTAYDRLMAQIAELETYYNQVYAKFVQAAPTQPSGWSVTYGNQLGGIQGAIQGMKATVGAAYGRMELNENSTISNYDSILEQLKNIEDAIDAVTTGISTAATAQQAAGQVFDLNGKRAGKTAKGLVIVDGKKVMVK